MVHVPMFSLPSGARANMKTAIHWLLPLILTGLGLFLVNLIWLYPALRNIRESASILALEISHRVETTIAADLTATLNDVQAAADDIASEPDRSSLILERLLRRHASLARVVRVERGGRELMRVSRPTAESMGESASAYTARPIFYAALQGVSSFDDVEISPERGPHTLLVTPIFRGGKAEEVLFVDVDLTGLTHAVREIPDLTGHMYIVDRNGVQVGHPDIAEVIKRQNFIKRPIVRKVILDGTVADGLAPEDEYVNEQGTRVFAVGFPIPIAGLGLIFEQPRSRALAGERQMMFFAAAAIALGLAFLSIILRSNIRLTRLNASMRELLTDLDNAGKMLVRRDLELTRANVRLEELDQIKSEFVSIAAHQLRTPLTGIRWSYQAILEEGQGNLQPEQRKLLESGLSTTLRMVDLVNDLLSVARIEEGKFGILLKKQALTPLLARFADLFSQRAREKGVAFLSEIARDPSIPDVAFDEEKLGIVFDNLLDNALKYTEPGGRITLRASREGDHVAIEIIDTGVGIPPGQMHRIFTKFFRADNALRLHTSGTGLGLYVVKNIVEKHGGTVEVESHEGKGTTFRMTLPVA